MNIKAVFSAAIVTVVIVGNAVMFSAQAGLNDQIDAVNDRRTAVAEANSGLQTAVTDLQTGTVQAQSALTALTDSIAAMHTGTPVSASGTYTALIQSIDPVTVLVNATGPGLRGFASGIIVSADGYVLTVLHNVDNANSIRVTLNTGEEFTATVVQTDAAANLALLKMSTSRTDLPVAALGAMADVQTGEAVIAAGYPLNDDLPGPASFTYGIVSALRTSTDYFFVQSEVPIAPGSGGGGLFTLNGKVIGLSSLAEATGIYLFVPIDLAEPLLALIPA
ncbi:MAG: trypsin-like peptidase domain-containing protein [Dehalogenimonas sp.]|uniref:Trypsin-like peptidase domain-containing protein n=1 Tax=Candidatus Dehalogenimonas loeffleri TaxID=3127115 RepID=A0ABZ2J7T6_9CHLR|nr:trypsin-like peptidase domain-containing protein [Dehalogenimonas sp.]